MTDIVSRLRALSVHDPNCALRWHHKPTACDCGLDAAISDLEALAKEMRPLLEEVRDSLRRMAMRRESAGTELHQAEKLFRVLEMADRIAAPEPEHG